MKQARDRADPGMAGPPAAVAREARVADRASEVPLRMRRQHCRQDRLMGTFPPIPTGRCLFALFALQVAACAGPGAYVWIADLPPVAPHDKEYIIQDGDVLEVRVFNQEPLSTHA